MFQHRNMGGVTDSQYDKLFVDEFHDTLYFNEVKGDKSHNPYLDAY